MAINLIFKSFKIIILKNSRVQNFHINLIYIKYK